MGDLAGLTLQLTSSSFGRDIGVPCMDAACTMDLNQLSVARNPDKPTQNKLKQNCESFLVQFVFYESFSNLYVPFFICTSQSFAGRPTEVSERDVFVCQSRYDEGDGTIRKMKVIKV